MIDLSEISTVPTEKRRRKEIFPALFHCFRSSDEVTININGILQCPCMMSFNTNADTNVADSCSKEFSFDRCSMFL